MESLFTVCEQKIPAPMKRSIKNEITRGFMKILTTLKFHEDFPIEVDDVRTINENGHDKSQQLMFKRTIPTQGP